MTNEILIFQAVLTYHFEVLQELKFSVYDVDSKSTNLNDHDFLGSCTTTLGQVSCLENTNF